MIGVGIFCRPVEIVVELIFDALKINAMSFHNLVCNSYVSRKGFDGFK